MDRYNPQEIEKKWQKKWEEEQVYKTEADPARPKYYALEMFPYPSGNLHMGHVRNYSIGDVMARYKTMEGYNVLHPMGFDSFGMPAENAAIKHGVKPADWTYSNIENMERQQKEKGVGQLVRYLRYGARERAGHRRQVLALRLARGEEGPLAVVPENHGLRRCAAEGPR